jgi:hypothetical protein
LVWNFLNIQPYGWVANFDVIRHPFRIKEKKISKQRKIG